MLLLIDIDGVLADTWQKRHLIRGSKPDWEKFYDSHGDEPRLPLAGLIGTLTHNYEIHFITARPERVWPATWKWLYNNTRGGGFNLIMRPDDSPPFRWKLNYILEVYPKDIVAAVFEDEPLTAMGLMQKGYPVIPIHSGYYNWPPR